jgi:putative heme iron utilization protein
MKAEDREILRALFREVRVLALGVLVDGEPHVGLLPFVVADDFGSALVHASQLAKHSRGLKPGSPVCVMIHAADDSEGDPLQVARVTLSGTVRHVAKSDGDYRSSRQAYIDRFPTSEPTFSLGDFNLYRLTFERGRLVAGFARAVNLRPESLAEMRSP